MIRKLGAALLAASMLAGQIGAALPANTVSVQFPAAVSARPLDGRLILIVTPKPSPEPRKQVALEAPLRSAYIFGKTVDGWAPATPTTMGAETKGWPVELADLPEGDYSVQAVLNRYETFHRATGPAVKLAPDMGEGQHWERKPGNLYSKPVRVHLGPNAAPLTLSLDAVMPAVTPPADTPFVKHIRIQSALLTKYWGRPTYLGAYVLLPAGFAEHPQAHFPLMVNHGHFPEGIDGWRESPPDPTLKPDYSERFHLAGYNRIQQQESYANYQKWIAKDFPRFLVVQIEHANPFFDDSYAVNSANLGPYGDAINKELIPEIEKRFRGIGQGWARFTYGGSTGGWEAMATQVFYPDMYNGAFIACPDPIDFRAYTTIALYKDKNAFFEQGVAVRNERIAMRDYLGQNIATQRDENIMELVMGDKTRSGGQYDIWQAVFGPMGADGYPQPIFDKATGVIDPATAAYWREHFDLTHIVERDWKTLAPKLQGKLHIYVGSADTYFLTNAVYFAQDTLEKLQPAYGGSVDYGDRAEHCWNGDHQASNAYSRLHYNWMYLPIIMKRIQETAPKGADLTSWRY
ncbi:hypothetical protein [Sphingomonas nostoxanthinifaciens]|uniref:hypothetical protein n=1 Tax=Sphingomonas nostoxanthinifaciens TaxID=2872652 RepID=UPI001CC1DBAE|nr:hypothetical protein [Sphingomonas nostoxanthinifaciens]UAK23618.1 hypothetical protein K8P63_14670 [Sphingomonas nostoxanthinifaciens]